MQFGHLFYSFSGGTIQEKRALCSIEPVSLYKIARLGTRTLKNADKKLFNHQVCKSPKVKMRVLDVRVLGYVTQKIVTILEIERQHEVLISALTGEVTNSIGLDKCQ